MWIKITCGRTVTADKDYEHGQAYDLPDDLALAFVEKGFGEFTDENFSAVVDESEPEPEPEPEPESGDGR